MTTQPLLTKPIRYRNTSYDFSITFPRWWDKYCVADCTRCDDERETTVSFRFRYRGRVYDPIITISIEPISRKEWEQQYEDSPYVWLGEHNGHSYSYMLAEELPEEFLRPDKMDYDYARYGRPIRLMKAMVTQAPFVLKSFTFL
jgi:hypothetical protein